jgi:hypothetical protein
MTKASFNIQLQGFPAANRDATVSLVSEATGQRIERKTFLDGSLQVKDLDPGFYEVEVRHPNLIGPIDRRRVRLFPQVPPTKVTVPIEPDLFRDTPIRDIPDVDLAPIRQAAAAAKESVAPLGSKIAGEAIRAADWNALVGAVSSLADAVVQMTQAVTPVGHNHPELEEKFGEVQGNLRRFVEAFGRSLLELRREIEAENLRRNVTEVLDLGGATADQRTRVLERVNELNLAVQVDTPQFTQKTAVLGNLVLNTVNEIAVAQGANADVFLQNPTVQTVQGMARSYSDAGVQTKPEAELLTYQATTTAARGRKLSKIVGG